MIEENRRVPNGAAQYEIIDWAGNKFGPFGSTEAAAEFAKRRWPDQEQDEERSGRGWDIQVGAD